MDIKGVFSNIKQSVISLFEKIVSYYQTNRKQAVLITVLGCSIILLVILLCASLSKKSKPKTTENNIVLSETPLIPSSPEIQENYTLSRTTKDKWTTEEADEWFTVPGQKDIDSLSKMNENLVSDITEAAP